MIFQETKLQGVFHIFIEALQDERGFFARQFCEKEFSDKGLWTDFKQCNLSYNAKRGTLRGMHYQKHPYEEVKVVSCVKGAIYDVALDIREDSRTYGQWVAFELTENNHEMLYLPKGIAHGFQTLEDDTMVYYQMGQFFEAGAGRGIRFDDPRFDIYWPIKETIMSEKDKNYR